MVLRDLASGVVWGNENLSGLISRFIERLMVYLFLGALVASLLIISFCLALKSLI
jgi:hypothetical protein